MAVMWNPFKRKYLVPVDECIDAIINAMHREGDFTGNLWDWIESKGVKRKWSWRESKNFLVFSSPEDYTVFLLKL